MIEISGQEEKGIPQSVTIIVKDTKDFSEEEFYKAISHGTYIFLETISKENNKNFKDWINGRFRKILKRAKINDFNKIKENLTDYIFHKNDSVELIFMKPELITVRNPIIKRAQVSGLNVLEESFSKEESENSFNEISISLNSQLDYSVSKKSIAVSHIIQELYFLDKNKLCKSLLNNSLLFKKEIIENDESKYSVIIKDAGLTEVEPGSITAAGKFNF